MERLKKLIYETVRRVLNERYTDSSTPINSRTRRYYSLGVNPLTVDNGGHSSGDITSLVSTEDFNGGTFRTNDKIVLSDNKFSIYKIKNFGNDNIRGTIDLFGKGAQGEINLRKAIDTVNGAAVRQSRDLVFRTITSESNKKMVHDVRNTFWEFSYDNGNTWYILKPEPVQQMKQSKLVRTVRENLIREAMMDEFDLKELSNIKSFNKRVEYCFQYLGRPIGGGSSRVVFQIDDEKCLKLAKNSKGVAQNEAEYYSGAQDYEIGPEVFDYGNNGEYIVAEYVLPAKKQDFKQCLGIDFNYFIDFVKKCYITYASRRESMYVHSSIDNDTFNEMLENNEWFDMLYRYMSDSHLPFGDLTRLANYGLCNRNGRAEIVILDSGFNEDTMELYQR